MANDNSRSVGWLVGAGFVIGLIAQSNLDDIASAVRRSQTGYVIIAKDCNQTGVCAGYKFGKTIFDIDRGQNQVVWLDSDTGEIGQFEHCVIFDASNWHCEDGAYVMQDGLLQRTEMDRVGSVYRVRWGTWAYARIAYELGLNHILQTVLRENS